MAVADSARIYDTITDCIGNTPLVRLRRSAADCPATILGKMENLNPLWSVKDRIGRAMIDAAERLGQIRGIRSSSSRPAAIRASAWLTSALPEATSCW